MRTDEEMAYEAGFEVYMEATGGAYYAHLSASDWWHPLLFDAACQGTLVYALSRGLASAWPRNLDERTENGAWDEIPF